MQQTPQISTPKPFISNAVVRTTALWAASEAFLGGMLHALKVPMAGIILAGFASICITVIALSTKNRGNILKATLVVIAVKFLLSPHTPVMAYLAVGIQGMAGELFFLRRKYFKWPAFLISIFCLIYSAIQRLLVLTILFGMEFWQASNQFLNGISESFGMSSDDYISYIIIFYLACYFFAGILVGIINIKITQYIKDQKMPDYVTRANTMKSGLLNVEKRTRSRYRKFLIPIAIISLILLLASYLPFFEGGISRSKILMILLRGFLITCVWLLVIAPLLKKAIDWFLKEQNITQSSYFKSVIQLLPEMKEVIQKSWAASKTGNKLVQIQRFITTCFLLVVFYD